MKDLSKGWQKIIIFGIVCFTCICMCFLSMIFSTVNQVLFGTFTPEPTMTIAPSATKTDVPSIAPSPSPSVTPILNYEKTCTIKFSIKDVPEYQIFVIIRGEFSNEKCDTNIYKNDAFLVEIVDEYPTEPVVCEKNYENGNHITVIDEDIILGKTLCDGLFK